MLYYYVKLVFFYRVLYTTYFATCLILIFILFYRSYKFQNLKQNFSINLGYLKVTKKILFCNIKVNYKYNIMYIDFTTVPIHFL